MLDIIDSFCGMMTIKLVSASPEMLLTKFIDNGIFLKNIRSIDDISFCADIHRKDFRDITALVEKEAATVDVIKTKGVYWELVSFLKRPVLFAMIILYVFTSIWLTTRVLFVEVTGNNLVSKERILEAVRCSGISFGASRSRIRSEKSKNMIIEMIPELQWVGINTKGSVAYISVKEKDIPQEDNSRVVSSICASDDGTVTELTVTRGNPVVTVGDDVKMGDILISGYTDCGISIKGERAEGEVFADTSKEVSVISLSNYRYRYNEKSVRKKYSMIIGKKLINFYKGSGILGDSCVRMYKRYVLSLPGGFQLPFELICITEAGAEVRSESNIKLNDFEWAKLYTRQYLQQNMISGEIHSEALSETLYDDYYSLDGKYFCTEMIGRICTEELIEDYGERD